MSDKFEERLILKSNQSLPKNHTGCVEFEDGRIFYLVKGQIHRTDGPAIIYQSGSVSWYILGKKYLNKHVWFDALNFEQKKDAIWSLDEWGNQ